MNPQRFYVTCSSSNTIKEFAGVIKALPILWCRDGEYKVVPKEVVQNAINIMNMYAKFDGKRIHPMPTIHWDQGIPINNLAGRALLGE